MNKFDSDDILSNFAKFLSIDELVKLRGSSKENNIKADAIINQRHLKRFGAKYSSRSIDLKISDLKWVTYRELLHIIANSAKPPIQSYVFEYPEDESKLQISLSSSGEEIPVKLDDIYDQSEPVITIHYDEEWQGEYIVTDYFNPFKINRYSNIINNIYRSVGIEDVNEDLGIDSEMWNVVFSKKGEGDYNYTMETSVIQLIEWTGLPGSEWPAGETTLAIIVGEEYLQESGELGEDLHVFNIKDYISQD